MTPRQVQVGERKVQVQRGVLRNAKSSVQILAARVQMEKARVQGLGRRRMIPDDDGPDANHDGPGEKVAPR